MVVALLRNTNLFRAFTASSTIPSIYIQQFWDTMRHDSSTRLYSCQLDEQWFTLHKEILRDALDITPSNDNNPFVAPPSSDIVIEYVNTLGYPNTLQNVSAMSVNALDQPWRDVLSMINMCLTEFVQSIQTFLTYRKNLATESRGKKKSLLLVISNVRFTKLIIHHLRSKHNIYPRPCSPLHYSHDESVLNALRYSGKDGRVKFGMPILDALLTNEIRTAPYYSGYLEQVVAYQRYLAEEQAATKTAKQTKPSKPKATKPTKPAESQMKDQGRKRRPAKDTTDAPPPAKRSKSGKVIKKQSQKSSLQLVDEVEDEGAPEMEPRFDDEEADMQKAMEESLKDAYPARQGLLPPVVFREPEPGKFQPLSEVRIYQKSHENHQKRANTDTRNGRAQEKPKIQSQSQEKSTLGVHWAIQVKYNAMAGSNQSNQVLSLAILSIKATWLWKKAQGEVGFTLGSLREVAQAVTSRMTAWQSLSVHT
ncbi:monodehydroascorbate reductase [Tanacetum coccineum]